ncbi:carbohydrate-binding domain-containing protein [Candidatus Bathyarchaeota archaeon]|nr:carbohydrate-binding domain-containing protein [Candidatus Bathyarchaeota archaeon]
MGRKELILLFVCACLLLSLVVYAISQTDLLNGNSDEPEGGSPTPTPSPSAAPTPTPTALPSTTPTPTPSPSETSSPTPSPSPTSPPTDPTVNAEDHEDPEDYVWNSADVIDIELNGASITVNPAGAATVDGSTVTITSAANYRVTGSLSDGQVIVDTDDEETVRLILNGVDITCSNSAPIYIVDSEKVIIVLQEGTENYVTDGVLYILEPDTDEPNAAIFSKSDLTIYGEGTLTVDANYNDGIASKDGLIIKSGTVNVNSVDDGIRGKDYLVVKGGNVTLNVDGDGFKSDNDADVTRGYVSVESGVVSITSDRDAIEAQTDVIITGGDLTLTSGGGSTGTVSEGTSAKGVKGLVSVIIDGGTITANCADDAIHSNSNITVNGGSFDISTGDDGFHADTYLIINGGNINITQCFEGLESSVITINSGIIRIESSDDGINVAGGNDDGPADPFAPPDEGQWLHINGGYIVVSSDADGIDTNGFMDMSGGIVIVNGPTSNMEAAIDYGFGTFKITGGTLVALGSSGMAQAPSGISTQYSVHIKLNFPRLPTLIHLNTTSGEVFTFMPTKNFQSIVYSSPQLAPGLHTLYLGGSSTGTPTDGLYEGGTYTPGNLYTSFTISGIVTTIGGWGGP